MTVLSRNNIECLYHDYPYLESKMREGLSIKYINITKTINTLKL